MVKSPPANSGDVRDLGSIPGSGRSPGGGHNNPLQYSCLENPMDRGAWRATVHSVAKSWTRLKQLSTAQHKFIDSRSLVNPKQHKYKDTHGRITVKLLETIIRKSFESSQRWGKLYISQWKGHTS